MASQVPVQALSALLAIGVAGCFPGVHPDDCTLRCGSRSACPIGYVCSQGLCTEGDSCASPPGLPDAADVSDVEGEAAGDDASANGADGGAAPDGAPGECAVDDTQTEGCSCTGTRLRTCGADGVWGPWEGCVGGGVCDSLGETRTVGCGCGGSMTQACDASCQWQSTTECSGEQFCMPDEICPSGRCCWGSGHFCNQADPSRCCSGVCNGFCT